MDIITVNKDNCKVDSLYQWDFNRVLEIRGLSLPKTPEIHFTNDAMEKAIVRQATMDDTGVITVDIPNTLLQKPYKITVYVCIYEEDTFKSLYKFVIPIKARKKPTDYTFQDTEGEIYSYNALENKMDNTISTVLERYDEVNTKYAEVNEKYITTTALVEELADDLQEANNKLDTAQELYENGMEEIGDCRLEMDRTISDSTKAFSNAKNAYDDSVENYEEASNKYNEALEILENAGENEMVNVDVPNYIVNKKVNYIGPGESWEYISLYPPICHLKCIAYGADKFVGVGENGIVCYSTDGKNWIAVDNFDTADFYGVAYGNGKFVCVGYNRKSYYSLDGIVWEPTSGLGSGTYRAITFGDGKFVTIEQNNGKSYYSEDGEIWIGFANTNGRDILRVAFGDGKFVCVGLNGKAYCCSNLDTDDWETAWVAMTGIDSGINIHGITYGNDRFVCVGDNGKSYYSTNGETWTVMTGLDDNYSFKSVAYGDGRFVVVGESENTYYSTNGETWTAIEKYDDSTHVYVAFGDYKFVSTGSSEIICLEDVIEVFYVTDTIVNQKFVAISDVLTELYNKSVVLKKTMLSGSSEIVFNNSRIKEDSFLTIFTSIYGVNPNAVIKENGKVTLRFESQETDVMVGVRIDG